MRIRHLYVSKYVLLDYDSFIFSQKENYYILDKYIHTSSFFSLSCFLPASSNSFLLTFVISVHGYGTDCLHSFTGFFNFIMNPMIERHSFLEMSFLLMSVDCQSRIYVIQNELLSY